MPEVWGGRFGWLPTGAPAGIAFLSQFLQEPYYVRAEVYASCALPALLAGRLRRPDLRCHVLLGRASSGREQLPDLLCGRKAFNSSPFALF